MNEEEECSDGTLLCVVLISTLSDIHQKGVSWGPLCPAVLACFEVPFTRCRKECRIKECLAWDSHNHKYRTDIVSAKWQEFECKYIVYGHNFIRVSFTDPWTPFNQCNTSSTSFYFVIVYCILSDSVRFSCNKFSEATCLGMLIYCTVVHNHDHSFDRITEMMGNKLYHRLVKSNQFVFVMLRKQQV